MPFWRGGDRILAGQAARDFHLLTDGFPDGHNAFFHFVVLDHVDPARPGNGFDRRCGKEQRRR